MTGEYLRYKPGVAEKVKFEYFLLNNSPLNNKVKSKTDKRNKVVNTDKQDKSLIYNPQHSFNKFKDISDFEELSLDSMHEKLNDFHKKLTKFKNVNPQRKENEDLKAKVLGNVGGLFNDLYYIYKERYEEEKDILNKKTQKKIDYTKLRLVDEYLYDFEEEDKKPDKKETPKNQQKLMCKHLMN